MPRTVYRDAALADGTGPTLRVGVSLLVDDDRIEWIRPTGDEPDAGPDVEVVDASGATIVPGLVDSHSHLTMPGGAHWIERGFDSAEQLLRVAEHNARLQRAAGVRWTRFRQHALCSKIQDVPREKTREPLSRNYPAPAA